MVEREIAEGSGADPEEQPIAILMTQHYRFGVELMAPFPVMVDQAIDD